MRKNVFGRRFKRDANARKALFKGLMSSLVLDEKIKTTEAKAKSIKADIEKLVTKAKKREEEARRFLLSKLTPEAADKVIERIAPQFAERPGGYTRIVRLGNRATDSASMVVMEWVETIVTKTPVNIVSNKPKKKISVKPKTPVKKVSPRTKKTAPAKKAVSKSKAKK